LAVRFNFGELGHPVENRTKFGASGAPDATFAVITGFDPVIQTTRRRQSGDRQKIARNQPFAGFPGQARQ
jgi:hypothetical protein